MNVYKEVAREELELLVKSAKTDFEEEVFRMFANTFKEKKWCI